MPCNTATSTLSCLFQQKERDKAEVSTSTGGTGARCVRPWLTSDIVCLDTVVPERTSQVSKRSEVVCINGAPSTPGYLLALLWKLSHVPRGLTEIVEAKQPPKTNQSGILHTSSIKGSESRCSRFEPKISLISFSRGSGPPFKSGMKSRMSKNRHLEILGTNIQKME